MPFYWAGGPLPGRAIPVLSRKLPPSINNVPFDPHSLLFTNSLGQSLLPSVMYRYQLSNANFPTNSGDQIQVSPLMEKIAYQWLKNPQGFTNTIIHDPFITATTWTYLEDRYMALWLIDRQPQISGASYQYVLVRFGARHEIEQLVPSNKVDVP